MNYRRVLLLVDLECAAGDTLAELRRVAPEAELLLIVARLSATRLGWLSTAAPAELNDAAAAALEALRAAAARAAKTVDIRVESEPAPDQIAELARAAHIDLIVTRSHSGIAELRKRTLLPVLWVVEGRSSERPLATVFCVAIGDRARRAVAVFLRDHATPSMHAKVLTTWAGDPAGSLRVAGITARVELTTRPPVEAPDLIVLARSPGVLLATRRWNVPVLVLSPLPTGIRAVRAMDVADVADDHGVLRLAAQYALGVGRIDPIPDQKLAIVHRGQLVAVVSTEHGLAEFAGGFEGDALGVYRVAEAGEGDPLMAVEQEVAVLRAGSAPLVLFDAELDEKDLRILSVLDGLDRLAVRMRPMKSCAAIRRRLQMAGLAPRVIDARAVLDEGPALDVGEAVDAVRLARVAARLRGAGFPIAAIVHRGLHSPFTIEFAAMRADEIASNVPRLHAPSPPASRLAAATGTPLIEGNSIELELDNAKARKWLLDAIGAAKQRVHLQVYMAVDDDVGSTVEVALAAAADRGVAVRVVVDSLHGLHGSFGLQNPLLRRLAACPGVELRAWRPVTGVPSLEDLKQRDHRKLAIIDGAVALVGGRNLSHEYYAGFDEVRLSRRSVWREVPWLDAGARVEGPAVATLDGSFLDAWVVAGGAPFDLVTRPRAGSSAARVVIHHGLRDARTLDAYLAMLDDAESHVYAVNGFPLILEIQHALLRALRRGVRVRTLFGNLTPTHGGGPFQGPWATARIEATELVHSRMDDLVAAGAEAYQLRIGQQPSWEPGLGTVAPHVHAKVISVDGRLCSVGSANLDITAGYWESELVLIMEDAAIASSLESQLDTLMSGSLRVDRDDPEWQKTAGRRTWMRYWPGVLSV